MCNAVATKSTNKKFVLFDLKMFCMVDVKPFNYYHSHNIFNHPTICESNQKLIQISLISFLVPFFFFQLSKYLFK